MNPIAIRCSYRARGYSDDELKRLADELSEIGNLQRRPQGLPEAGGAYEISFVAQFLGELVAAGVIYDVLKHFGKRLLDFYRRKNEANGEPPEIELLELRFDNVDLRLRGARPADGPDCNFLSETTLQNLPEIVADIYDHVSSEPLASADMLGVDVFEPQVTDGADGTPEFSYVEDWKITGIDFTAPSRYSPDGRTLEGDYDGPG